jgi:translation initiation factor IF-2
MKEEKRENSIPRPPIVVVLGHIDHGKSSLLEAIKDLKITEKESGGITQNIGAYQIEEKDKKITFIDTPGHEAFSQMRSRGAKVADIAILVVDATEGVKAQTKEAISLIKESGISVIVALNKMDKPGADPEKMKKELSQAELLVEGAGGKTPFVEISAKTRQGIANLLDLILLVAEMEDLKADIDKPAQGVVVESYLDNLRGPTATLLLADGVLRPGDVIGTPSAFTKVKSLENFQKVPISEAFPSTPVIIFGFNQVPKVGEEFKVFSDVEAAKSFLKVPEKKTLEISGIPEKKKVLTLILKTDVAGSIEAIEETLKGIPQEKVALRILKSEVGSINESDIKLAKGGKSLILGFRVKIDPVVKKLTEREGVRIVTFEVIYDLVEGIRKLMEKIAGTEEVRLDLGKVRVLANFLTEKNRQIIGGKITEGEVKKGALIEIFRADEKIGQGKLVNLQKNKKDLDVLGKGEECGILFEGEGKVKEGDTLVVFQRERQKI